MIFSFQIFYSWLQITSLQSNNVHLPSAPTCPAGPGRTPKTANKACSPFRKSLRKGITTRDARSSHLLMFSLNLHNHLFRDEKTEFREDKSLSVSQRKSQKSPQVWLQTQTPYIHNSPPLRWSKHILGQTGKKKKKKNEVTLSLRSLSCQHWGPTKTHQSVPRAGGGGAGSRNTRALVSIPGHCPDPKRPALLEELRNPSSTRTRGAGSRGLRAQLCPLGWRALSLD